MFDANLPITREAHPIVRAQAGTAGGHEVVQGGRETRESLSGHIQNLDLNAIITLPGQAQSALWKGYGSVDEPWYRGSDVLALVAALEQQGSDAASKAHAADQAEFAKHNAFYRLVYQAPEAPPAFCVDASEVMKLLPSDVLLPNPAPTALRDLTRAGLLALVNATEWAFDDRNEKWLIDGTRPTYRLTDKGRIAVGRFDTAAALVHADIQRIDVQVEINALARQRVAETLAKDVAVGKDGRPITGRDVVAKLESVAKTQRTVGRSDLMKAFPDIDGRVINQAVSMLVSKGALQELAGAYLYVSKHAQQAA